MIRHILLIQFKSNAPQSQIDAVKDAFIAFPETIDGIEAIELGENDSPEGKNRGYTHCVLMTFRDEASRQSYLSHQKHDALKSIFRPVLEDIIVLDYTVR